VGSLIRGGTGRGNAGQGETASASSISRTAWAKVNLYIAVTGRRPDGYHELDSLVVFAGIGDRLDFVSAEGLELEVEGRFAEAVPRDRDNLVIRAAEALAAWGDLASRAPGARIRLDKRLPVAAGLGGGSADAAATLEGLGALWDLKPEAGVLAELAADLGADVPVCLYGRPALIRGIGERIERAPPLPPAWLVLVNPGVALPTAQVFARREGGFTEPAPWGGVAETCESLAGRLAERGNDLEAPALELAPEIGRVLAALKAQEGVLLARLSGSGATCFGLCASQAEARAAAAAIAAAEPDWWAVAAPLLHGKLDRLRGL
jgi:4-diphosphocytidyl-2-C-methyl-D-erythritol kinase